MGVGKKGGNGRKDRVGTESQWLARENRVCTCQNLKQEK